MLVAGPLDSPANLKISRDYSTNTTTITWKPPFSLDLTQVHVDVLYCLEVYNVTCGGGELLISDCNITEPRYHSNILQPAYIYSVTVTPASNVKGAFNGTSTHVEGS